MANIDDKVVAMSFESSRFESGVNRTISALDKLKAALHFPGAGKGLADIDAAVKKVDLGHISNGVRGVIKALDSLRLVAIGVMSQLTAQAVRAGGRFVKAFTLDPLKAGFSEYTTNLNAVQTILANTQAAGVKLKDVNATLKELNEYSDKTIYNFSQMAKNIGTFTAAGVDLDTATASIKGIANLAALSGSTSDQASTAMYQLSQAISAGRVSLQDWNSVVNAGMGGTVFQRALATTAEAMGTLKEGSVKLVGPMKNVSIAGESFRQSVSAAPGKESWLTSKVLTSTLKQFTGDLTNAELAAMGFNKAQIKAIQQTATTAFKAATEVKTLQGVLDTAKESAASGWAETWQIIFGDFAEAKVLFTNVSNAINGFIGTSADARNKVLSDWKALGGRTVLINSIKTAFQNLGKIIAPIKDAFRDIFPATTGKDLYNLTLRFQDFAKALEPSKQTVEDLRRTFRGLFAIFSIAGQVIGEIVGLFGRLFGAVGDGSGGFLDFTGNIGDWLVRVDQAMKKGKGLHDFFTGLGDIIAVPLNLLKRFASALGDLFSGFSSGGFSEQMGGMSKAMGPFGKIIDGISSAWSSFIDSVRESGILQAAFDGLIKFVQGIGPAIGKAASGMNFEAILAVIRTGLFGGLVLMLKNFFGKGSFLDQISKGFGGGIIENISGSFKALEGSMVALQNNIKAKTLKEIAIAIALLAVAVVALSFVDPDKLTKALTGIGVMMGELLAAMAVLSVISKSAGFIKLPFIAASLILLAGAIDLLVIAVVALSFLSWEELLKGLAGVAGLLVALSAASIPLSANSGGMVRAGIAIGIIAVAMNILAIAMKQFAGMEWEEIGKGLVTVAGALAIMAAATQAMPKGMVAQGVGIVAIAVGLKILAGVMEQFAGQNWTSIAKGLAGIGGALVIIAGAMHLMPKGIILQAAGLLILSFALGKIADAVEQMGGMSMEEIGKGLGVLAGALLILAGALYLMSGTLAGAAALTIAAAGIALLVPAIQKLGDMSWGEILKGLVALGAALAIIGIAAVLLTPAVPSMLAFGAALILIGAGLALAGAGIFLIGLGLSAIAVAGPAAIGILVTAFQQLVEGLIENAKLLVLGLLEILDAFAAMAPQFVDAMLKILSALLDGVVKIMPQVGEAFNAIITTAIGILNQNQGRLIQAGFNLLKALLQGLKNNLPALITLVADIVVKLIQGLTNNIGRIAKAGSDLLLALVKGMASHITNVAVVATDIIVRFINTISNSLGRILTAGTNLLVRFLKGIGNNLGDVIAAGVDIVVAVVTGIGNAGERIVRAARQAAGKFIKTLASEIVKLADDCFEAMITLMNGLAQVIEDRAPEMRTAAIGVGKAIIAGLTSGVTSAAGDLYAKIQGVMDKAMSLVHKIPIIGSPSKVTTRVGEYIILGLVKGMENTESDLYSTTEGISQGVIDKFNEVFQTNSPSRVMMEIGKFVAQGFAKGLRSGSDEIKSAFAELNEKLLDAMVDARETIAEEQKKLKELQAASKPDVKAIKEAQAVIAENEAILRKTTAAHTALVKGLKEEKAELISLSNEYDKISAKLKTAQEKLAEATKTRDEAIKSFTDQYSALPEFGTTMAAEIADANTKIAEAQANLSTVMTESAGDIEKIAAANKALVEAEGAKATLLEGKVLNAAGTQVDLIATYMAQLKQKTADVKAYRETLAELRKLGLDKETYQMLLEQGTAGQEFATELLAGGETAIKGVGDLTRDLEAEAKKLGVAAGRELHQSGVNSAQSLVKGLTSQKAALIREVEAMADEIVAAFNRRLKIKSPSQVFAEIGEYMMKGLAKGFSDSSNMVTNAVDAAAQGALNAMKKSVRTISDIVTNELNPNPVITPILDLTQVRAQARELDVIPITAAASYGQASAISASQLALQEDQLAAGLGGTSVKFEQNNYSPASLSEIEIYRQTKNQLSQIKSALALT